MHYLAAANSVALPGNLNLAGLIPLLFVGLVWFGLVRSKKASHHHMIIGIILGVIVAGTVFGPDISNIIRQISQGYL